MGQSTMDSEREIDASLCTIALVTVLVVFLVTERPGDRKWIYPVNAPNSVAE